VKLISLTQGKFAQVSDEDYDRLSKFKWQWVKPRTVGATGYATRTKTYTRSQRVHVFMHQMVCAPMLEYEADHRDGDGLNNQRDNLRLATRAQQCQNRPHRVTANSLFKGVKFEPRAKIKPWGARIHCGSVRKSLGTFSTAEDAATAYNLAALELFGEFAWFNTPRIG